MVKVITIGKIWILDPEVNIMKNRRQTVSAVVVITIVVVLILFMIQSIRTTDRDTISFYTVEIEVTNKDNYTLILPFPTDEYTYVADIYQNITIEYGDVNYEIRNTTKGLPPYGIEIHFTDDVKISWQGHVNTLFNLSMANRTDNNNEFWDESPEWFVFLESSNENNVRVYLRYEVDNYDHMEGYLIDEEISGGWSSIMGKKIFRYD